MIVALSYDSYEQGTDPVIDWLLYYKAKFMRMSMVDLLFNRKAQYRVDYHSGHIYMNGRNITDRIKVIWYRRFMDTVEFQDGTYRDWPVNQASFEIGNEIKHFVGSLYSSLAGRKWLPHPQYIDVNKLSMIKKAKDAGLQVPRSTVTNNKKDLVRFMKQCPDGVITKPVNHSGYYIVGKSTYAVFTTPIEEHMLGALPDLFFPSLFQEKVASEYEIRVFYLDGEIYATAVLNEGPDKAIDVKLNYKKDDTFWVPYNFPAQEAEKIRSFMDRVGLNTGSLDILKKKDGEYVFLEVNPVGQYSAPSARCNYEVERRMAEWLMKHDQ